MKPKRQSAALHGNALTQQRLISAFNLGQLPESDSHTYGIVRAINSDGSFGVQLGISADITRCAPFCYAEVGDRVLVLIFNGKCAAIARDNTDLNVDGHVYTNGSIYMSNNKRVFAKNSAGKYVATFSPCEANDVLSVGYGNYAAGLGVTRLYGNDLKIFNKATGVDGRSYGENKVLASPNWYMAASQTVTLSEAISAQPHGIVLHWCYYDSSASTASTGNNYYCVIPKWHVLNRNGNTCPLLLGYSNRVYRKILTISDTTLVGNAVNDNTAYSMHGETVNNRVFVLRTVIGY